MMNTIQDPFIFGTDGTNFGQFELMKAMYPDNMGFVYRAASSTYPGELRLRVMPKLERFSSEQRQVVEHRFVTDSMQIKRLNHPNIAPIYAYNSIAVPHKNGSTSERFYVVTPFLEGGTLKDRLMVARDASQMSLPSLTEITDFLEVTADALDHAHHNGVVHRSISSRVFYFDETGQALIVDFGVAGFTGEFTVGSNVTTHTSFADELYKAPETEKGVSATGAADQYALALVIFEMLTNDFAIEEREIQGQKQRLIRSVRSYRPDLPREIDKVIGRALLSDPSQRFSNITEFAIAFRTAAIGYGGQSTGFFTKTIRVYERDPEDLLTHDDHKERGENKSLFAFIVVALIALTLATGLIIFFLQITDDDRAMQIALENTRAAFEIEGQERILQFTETAIANNATSTQLAINSASIEIEGQQTARAEQASHNISLTQQANNAEVTLTARSDNATATAIRIEELGNSVNEPILPDKQCATGSFQLFVSDDANSNQNTFPSGTFADVIGTAEFNELDLAWWYPIQVMNSDTRGWVNDSRSSFLECTETPTPTATNTPRATATNTQDPDRDRDGILNTQDACPDQFGSSTANGCPDQDGDGIRDSQDNCPTNSNSSQQDTDGDGLGNVCDSTPDGPEIEAPETEEAETPCTDGHGWPCATGNTIFAGQSLVQVIVSNNGIYRLTVQSDGNVIVRRNSDNHPMWASHSDGKGTPDRVLMQHDGNFVVYDASGNKIWDTGTAERDGAYLTIQDNGSIVVYYDGDDIWNSNDHP